MNLIHSSWLPIIRRDGSQDKIAPWQITTDYASNPIVDGAGCRADFQGSIHQFLIGLLQYISLVEDEDDLEELFKAPPEPESLKSALAPLAPYFQFDGDGPLFLQDFDLKNAGLNSIGALLIDSPGENALRHNKDLFIKRGRVNAVCPACCALGLFTMQSSAPAGGAGLRTSLRGGGPLNALVQVLPKDGETFSTLWENVIVNVIPSEHIDQKLTSGNWKRDAPEDMFPWLKATVTSEAKTGKAISPEDIHPYQMYWGMPRRIRIDFENRSSGRCDLCGGEHDELIHGFYQKNYGINYEGPYQHPFSPYQKNKNGPSTPMHAQPGGVGYRHFPGIGINDESNGVESSIVVRRCRNYEGFKGLFERLRVWVFGYDMDNMKARNWYEAKMPVYNFSSVNEIKFFTESRKMVDAASNVLFQLRTQIQNACFSDGDARKKDLYKKSFWIAIETEYWHVSENMFYQKLHQVHESLSNGQEDQCQQIRKEWFEYLRKKCFTLFDQSQYSGEFEQNNPRRVVEAEIALKGILNSKKFSEKFIS